MEGIDGEPGPLPLLLGQVREGWQTTAERDAHSRVPALGLGSGLVRGDAH